MVAKGCSELCTTGSKNAGVVAWLDFEVADDGPHFNVVEAYDVYVPADPSWWPMDSDGT